MGNFSFYKNQFCIFLLSSSIFIPKKTVKKWYKLLFIDILAVSFAHKRMLCTFEVRSVHLGQGGKPKKEYNSKVCKSGACTVQHSDNMVDQNTFELVGILDIMNNK